MTQNEFLATPRAREKISALRRTLTQGSSVTVAVIGAGKSGLAAARLLESVNVEYQVFDDKPDYPSASVDALSTFDLIVLSPGVPRASEALARATEQDIVVGEIEFASWFIDIPMIGITGTNGKSTTTALLGHILEQTASRVFVGGNFGQPLSELALTQKDFDIAVVELSSYQLESLVLAEFNLGCWLNLSADHTDRYEDLESYARAKSCLIHHCPNSPVVLNADDDYCRRYSAQSVGSQAELHWFTNSKVEIPTGKSVTKVQGDASAVFSDEQRVSAFELKNHRLPGHHNQANMAAAISCAMALGTDETAIQKGLDSFDGLEHRIELVAVSNGVHWYNDSKATNVESALTGIRAMTGKTVLIAGGVDKGGSWQPLLEEQERLKKILVIGSATEIVLKAFDASTISCEPCDNLRNAVVRAFELANEGENVLLSPACSSFDQFDNYVHRGNVFKDLVSEQLGEVVR